MTSAGCPTARVANRRTPEGFGFELVLLGIGRTVNHNGGAIVNSAQASYYRADTMI